MTGGQVGPPDATAPLPGPIMVVHNRYQQRAGEDAAVDAEIAMLVDHGHDVRPFIVDSAAIRSRGLAGRTRLALEAVWSRRAMRQLATALRRDEPAIVHVHNTLPLLSPSIYGAIAASDAAVVQSLHNYRLVCPSANLFRDGRDCTDCVGRRFAWPGIVHGCYRDSVAQSAIVAAMLAASRVSGAWSTRVDRFIAPSQVVADAVGGDTVPADRIAIKPNFVVDDVGSGADGEREDSYLFAGRLAPEKGVATIVEAWERMPDLGAQARIAGDGPSAGQLASSAAADPRVVLLGRLGREALFAELGRARALIFPSIWREPFGLTVIEAFARGTPVIAARHGAPADLVEDGRTGLFFRPGDADDLAERIAWASGHAGEMAEMGRHGRQAFEERYTAAANYDALVAVYRDALRRRALRAGPVAAGAGAAGSQSSSRGG